MPSLAGAGRHADGEPASEARGITSKPKVSFGFEARPTIAAIGARGSRRVFVLIGIRRGLGESLVT